ncbi:hypothetical protein, partial [Clostridium sp.]|uniref:hypothetical protein n=1 Tax=Clostridium sp. TaxID=1506 RepID=UPI002FC92AA1
ESRIETIGSKYPFVTRNASIDYKEFSLSGTITHFMDETEEFAPRADLFVDDEFKSQLPYDMSIHYDSLYRENNLNNYNNTVLEREFRNRVEEFLLDGKPKLFKSPTEGNSIVRIMDVNMTPNQQLGRLIYDFSCNIIEVDSFNVFNLNKYNIQESGR